MTPNQNSNPDNGNELAPPQPDDDASRCQILLEELIHLIGLFLIHAGQSRGEQATDVLFDQMIRHLEVLQAMPDHEGGVLIRRADCRSDSTPKPPGYMVFFGNMVLQNDAASVAVEDGSYHRTKHLQSALNESFECLAAQGIHSLFIQFAGESDADVERLRLSMNIVARFREAAQEGVSITFRYQQRTLTIPLIADHTGRPDPNLTLVAAMNGLSSANTRALIAQAEAFQAMSVTGGAGEDDSASCISSYNKIFCNRGLRSQIVKPPVEINNLPWLDIQPPAEEDVSCKPDLDEAESAAPPDQDRDASPSKIWPVPVEVATPATAATIAPEYLAPWVDLKNDKVHAAVQMLTAEDYADLEPLELGKRLISLTQLLYAIDKTCQDPSVIDTVLDVLRHRLKDVPDDVLTCMIAKRQGLKINIPGRTVLVGMVHPRLFDLISLVKEHIVAGQRIAVIRNLAFDFDSCNIDALADGFGLSTVDSNQILKLLQRCIRSDGSFIRPEFEDRVEEMAQHGNAIFEILWCFLKETPRREDRLNFLNAFQLILARLRHPKQALQFLLADICQVPTGISYTDRNAFALSNILMHEENKELYVDISRTPEDALMVRRPLNQTVKQYAAWRLEMDQVRFATKLRTIHQAVQKALIAPKEKQGSGFEASFLLALEREAYLFAAFVGGHTARILLREALTTYSNPEAEIFDRRLGNPHLARLLEQLQVVVTCLGRAGHSQDIHNLNALGKNGRRLMGLDTHPAHRLRVKQVMKYAIKACRTIASRG